MTKNFLSEHARLLDTSEYIEYMYFSTLIVNTYYTLASDLPKVFILNLVRFRRNGRGFHAID